MISTLSKVGYKGGRKSYKESYDEKGLEDFEDVHPQGSHAAISSMKKCWKVWYEYIIYVYSWLHYKDTKKTKLSAIIILKHNNHEIE